MRVAVVAAVVLLPPAAMAAVHTVGEGESISEVLLRVAPGDTVHLTGAEYHENLRIDISISHRPADYDYYGGHRY